MVMNPMGSNPLKTSHKKNKSTNPSHPDDESIKHVQDSFFKDRTVGLSCLGLSEPIKKRINRI